MSRRTAFGIFLSRKREEKGGGIMAKKKFKGNPETVLKEMNKESAEKWSKLSPEEFQKETIRQIIALRETFLGLMDFVTEQRDVVIEGLGKRINDHDEILSMARDELDTLEAFCFVEGILNAEHRENLRGPLDIDKKRAIAEACHMDFDVIVEQYKEGIGHQA